MPWKSKQTYQTSKTIAMTWWLKVRYAIAIHASQLPFASTLYSPTLVVTNQTAVSIWVRDVIPIDWYMKTITLNQRSREKLLLYVFRESGHTRKSQTCGQAGEGICKNMKICMYTSVETLIENIWLTKTWGFLHGWVLAWRNSG